MILKKCHDCETQEGDLHVLNCDFERCPFCGHQLISCECRYTQLGFDMNKLPADIYEQGLPKELEEKWELILNKKGRVPYIIYPVVCVVCGALWPNLFDVSDEEWEKYIEPAQREKVICQPCYNAIKSKIDTARNQL